MFKVKRGKHCQPAVSHPLVWAAAVAGAKLTEGD